MCNDDATVEGKSKAELPGSKGGEESAGKNRVWKNFGRGSRSLAPTDRVKSGQGEKRHAGKTKGISKGISSKSVVDWQSEGGDARPRKRQISPGIEAEQRPSKKRQRTRTELAEAGFHRDPCRGN